MKNSDDILDQTPSRKKNVCLGRRKSAIIHLIFWFNHLSFLPMMPRLKTTRDMQKETLRREPMRCQTGRFERGPVKRNHEPDALVSNNSGTAKENRILKALQSAGPVTYGLKSRSQNIDFRNAERRGVRVVRREEIVRVITLAGYW